MKLPAQPPSMQEIFGKISPERLNLVMSSRLEDDYRHWDDLRHRKPPEGLTLEEWWCALKIRRFVAMKALPLTDSQGKPFSYSTPDRIAKQLHEIDLGAGGRIGMWEPVTHPDTRDQYLVRSLMEEAITSSQLEGAVTTRKVAKEMLRSGRPPRDKSERMILNNYLTMRRIREIGKQPLTPERVFEIHRLVTEQTLDSEDEAGRFRKTDERIAVEDVTTGEIVHLPPPAAELEERMAAMCAFANGEPADPFIHPAIRAIILHFWLAYDHPFVDGNGRTARALFYWAMLRADYWLFEYISISEVLRRAPVKYYRAFLHTETDDNDLTYFLLHQSDVIRQAIGSLHEYINRKTREVGDSERLLRDWRHLNHRQQALIGHALRHTGTSYTIEGHQRSHDSSYNTARTDLLDLVAQGLLDQSKSGKRMVFYPSPRLEQAIRDGSGKGSD
ncbi:MAG: Fic family protein [Verrucomicrobia bacterium]|nr:Fic family protein [Verrucomicrobiota bacterium]